jgi:hypothetical protein
MRAGHNLVSRATIAKLHEEHMTGKESCLRCDKPSPKTWAELSDEEREVVKRLPASRDYSLEERKASRRWCTRCWHEHVDTDNTDLT